MKRALILTLLLSLTAVVTADIEHRAPTPQEKAALEKALKAITNVVDTFGNADWVVASQSHPKTNDVSPTGPSPMNASLNYNRKYAIKEGSPLFKAKVLPAIEAIRKAMEAKDYAGATKAGEATNGTMDFTVETFINRINVPTGAKATNLVAKGATLAHDYRDASRGGDYFVVIGVGDWAHAKGGASAIDYRFRNPKGTPHVENIVFEFHTRRENGFGAERIREIVRTTDWGALDQGLTP